VTSARGPGEDKGHSASGGTKTEGRNGRRGKEKGFGSQLSATTKWGLGAEASAGLKIYGVEEDKYGGKVTPPHTSKGKK